MSLHWITGEIQNMQRKHDKDGECGGYERGYKDIVSGKHDTNELNEP